MPEALFYPLTVCEVVPYRFLDLILKFGEVGRKNVFHYTLIDVKTYDRDTHMLKVKRLITATLYVPKEKLQDVQEYLQRENLRYELPRKNRKSA